MKPVGTETLLDKITTAGALQAVHEMRIGEAEIEHIVRRRNGGTLFSRDLVLLTTGEMTSLLYTL